MNAERTVNVLWTQWAHSVRFVKGECDRNGTESAWTQRTVNAWKSWKVERLRDCTIIRLKRVKIFCFWFIIIKQSQSFDNGQYIDLMRDFVLSRFTLIRYIKPYIDLVKKLKLYHVFTKCNIRCQTLFFIKKNNVIINKCR